MGAGVAWGGRVGEADHGKTVGVAGAAQVDAGAMRGRVGAGQI